LADQEPITRVLGATRRRIQHAVGRRVHAHGLNPERFWVLVNLLEAPGGSLRELARRLRMDEPTASRIMASLARRRLVRARRDAADRRRRKLDLTHEGRVLAGELVAVAVEVRQAVEAGFTDEEKATLRRLLRRIGDNMVALEGQASRYEGRARAERGAAARGGENERVRTARG
jgi:MarR family transcriptional regulator, transcriptional regulator for hemolysin